MDNYQNFHILCVIPYYKPAYIYGGPSRSIPSLCEAMTSAGAEITVYTTNANGPGSTLEVPTDQPMEIDGVRVWYFPVSWPYAELYPFYSPELGHACDNHIKNYDVVYIPGIWTYPSYKASNAAITTKTPYVLSPRGSLMDWSINEKSFKKRIYLALIEKRLINSATAIHVTSSLEEQQLQKWKFIPPIQLIPNGVDLSVAKSRIIKNKFRQSLNIPESASLSLYVGRLHKEKRLDLIIRSFATIAKELANSHLLIVGADQDGSGEGAKALARQLGVSHRIHFTGLLTGSELAQAYCDADLLILVSHRENFGMVAVEAMVMGLPVLLAREVGIAAEVEKAKAGMLVNANPIEIGNAWRLLLLNQKLREEMGKNGENLVRRQFASEMVANQMLKLFSFTASAKYGSNLR